MLYILWMVILGDHNIKKKVSKSLIFELSTMNNYMKALFTNHLGHPPPAPNTQIR